MYVRFQDRSVRLLSLCFFLYPRGTEAHATRDAEEIVNVWERV